MLDVLARALDAGVRLVQLREKALDRNALEALVEQVLSLTARYDAMLLINSAVDVALKIGAQGVHLPSGDFATGGARSGRAIIFNRLFRAYPCGIRSR